MRKARRSRRTVLPGCLHDRSMIEKAGRDSNAHVSRTVDELEQALKATEDRVARAVQALKPKLTLKPEGFEAAGVSGPLLPNSSLSSEELRARPGARKRRWSSTGGRDGTSGPAATRTFCLSHGGSGVQARVNPLAIVEFERCYAHRFRGSNDEVIERPPSLRQGPRRDTAVAGRAVREIARPTADASDAP